MFTTSVIWHRGRNLFRVEFRSNVRKQPAWVIVKHWYSICYYIVNRPCNQILSLIMLSLNLMTEHVWESPLFMPEMYTAWQRLFMTNIIFTYFCTAQLITNNVFNVTLLYSFFDTKETKKASPRNAKVNCQCLKPSQKPLNYEPYNTQSTIPPHSKCWITSKV